MHRSTHPRENCIVRFHRYGSSWEGYHPHCRRPRTNPARTAYQRSLGHSLSAFRTPKDEVQRHGPRMDSRLTYGTATGITSTWRGDNQNGLFVPKRFLSHVLKNPQHDLPFSSKMLRNDGDEPFETSQDGAVNHHRPRRRLVRVRHFLRGTVLEVEPFR